MPRFAVRVFLFCLAVVRIALVIMMISCAMLIVFSLVGNMLMLTRDVVLPESLQFTTHWGFTWTMVVLTGVLAAGWFFLRFVRRRLQDALK